MRTIRYILFDLDGTLLPMDQDVFVHTYFGKLAKKMAPLGYDAEEMIKAIWDGTSEMVCNDGSRTNEAVFWDCFEKQFGPKVRKDQQAFDSFYRNEFQDVQTVCGRNEKAVLCVDWLQSNGYTVVLATNPIFPSIATESRIRWAGFKPEQFSLFTTYENTSFCKPNPAYYINLTERLNCRPEECLMVGNDVGEDMIAATVGMNVFLLTDCLINRHQSDISAYPHGGFTELLEFIKQNH